MAPVLYIVVLLIVDLAFADECVLVGSPSRGGDVVIYVFDINQPSLPTPFYSILVSLSALWSFQCI